MRNIGNLFVVAAPPGAGKTSLIREVLKQLHDIEVSISHTTRLPRSGEIHGVDYFFIAQEQFFAMIKNHEFVEYAEVFHHYYGTSIAQIKTRLQHGIDIVLDIDWQGAEQIKNIFPESLGIFILPPSLMELEKRLLDRAQDNIDIIKLRMEQVKTALQRYIKFDYLILNDDFQRAITELMAIVIANRVSIARQNIKLEKLLSFLLTSQ